MLQLAGAAGLRRCPTSPSWLPADSCRTPPAPRPRPIRQEWNLAVRLQACYSAVFVAFQLISHLVDRRMPLSRPGRTLFRHAVVSCLLAFIIVVSSLGPWARPLRRCRYCCCACRAAAPTAPCAPVPPLQWERTIVDDGYVHPTLAVQLLLAVVATMGMLDGLAMGAVFGEAAVLGAPCAHVSGSTGCPPCLPAAAAREAGSSCTGSSNGAAMRQQKTRQSAQAEDAT